MMNYIQNYISLLRGQLFFVLLSYVSIFIFSLCDFIVAIRIAKKRGVLRTSRKYRQSIDKLIRYYTLMFLVTFIDILQMLMIYNVKEQGYSGLPVFPFFCFVLAIFIAFIEFRSVYEKAPKGNRDKELGTAKTIIKLIKSLSNNDDLLHEISDVIESKQVRVNEDKEQIIIENRIQDDEKGVDDGKL